MIQSRLGWLNTVAEPQMEQKTKADIEIEVVQEKHEEDWVQDKDNDQQNQESTEPPEVTRSTENENVEKGGEEENVSAILVHVDVMEIVKEEKEEIGKAPDVVIVKQEIQQPAKVEST